MINNVYKPVAYCQEMNVIEEHGREPRGLEPVNWKYQMKLHIFPRMFTCILDKNRIVAPHTRTVLPPTHTHGTGPTLVPVVCSSEPSLCTTISTGQCIRS